MNFMENELYVETIARNLQEYNKISERTYNGQRIETVYAGFRIGPTGYKERYYVDKIIDTGEIIGDEYLIHFQKE